MIRKTMIASALAMAWLQAAPAVAQDTDMSSFDWGNDTSMWANDDECDDPRFEGPGASNVMLDEDLRADATDCKTLFEAGQISLVDLSNPAQGGMIFEDIDFGNDTSDYANDGECDDPRFEGPGTDEILLDEDRGRDASDCQALYIAGEIALAGEWIAPAPLPMIDGIQFGSDVSDWANDGECDDPRFSGTGMASGTLDPYDAYADGSDCLEAYEAGGLTYDPQWRFALPPTAAEIDAIDFGDDSSTWANDDECDDPRFEGQGAAMMSGDEDLMKDASDCRLLFMEGWVTLKE